MAEKYLVYKNDGGAPGEQVDDAVVIRRQDVFAPPALDAYANAIQTTLEALRAGDVAGEVTVPAICARLQGIADYFSDQAAKSWTEQRKLPD